MFNKKIGKNFWFDPSGSEWRDQGLQFNFHRDSLRMKKWRNRIALKLNKIANSFFVAACIFLLKVSHSDACDKVYKIFYKFMKADFLYDSVHKKISFTITMWTILAWGYIGITYQKNVTALTCNMRACGVWTKYEIFPLGADCKQSWLSVATGLYMNTIALDSLPSYRTFKKMLM